MFFDRATLFLRSFHSHDYFIRACSINQCYITLIRRESEASQNRRAAALSSSKSLIKMYGAQLIHLFIEGAILSERHLYTE